MLQNTLLSAYVWCSIGLLLFGSNQELLAQSRSIEPQVRSVEVQAGWSQNSINATIFRKNSLVSHQGRQYIAFYDSTAHVVLASRSLRGSDWEIVRTAFTGHVRDAHNSISMMVDGAGYLHLAWDHHNSPLKYACGLRPESLEMGEPTSMTDEQEGVVSYPEFYRLAGGDLIFAYRDGGSGNGNLVLNRYDIATRQWRRLHDNLIDGEGQRNAYWQMCVAGDELQLSWVWRESPDVASNHDLCYARSRDGGRTWERSTGEAYQLPITQATAEVACPIPQNSNLINQTSMTVVAGVPYIVTYFKAPEDTCTQFYLIDRQRGAWRRSRITNRTLDFDLSGGGTRSIPISRPQVVGRKRFLRRPRLFVIYREEAEGNAIVLEQGVAGRRHTQWTHRVLTDYSVDRWEPSLDTELWRTDGVLHLYEQRVGQGQGETAVALPAQMVRVLEVTF